MIKLATQTQLPSGTEAMTRLADKLAAIAPPPLQLTPGMIAPAPSPLPSPSPAVRAALATSAAIAKRADERARRSRSVIGMTVDGFLSACGLMPYALVALALRAMMANVFFFDGQALIEGARYGISLQGFDFSFRVPFGVKAEALTALAAAHPLLPVPPSVTAYLLGYGEFILPIMLLIGFGARFAAVGLIAMTALIQLYALPETLWSTHIYWLAILTVLVSQGPGKISLDHLVRLLARR